MNNQPDDFLDRDFSCETNDALQRALRDRTTSVLRRKRQLKWVGITALAAACYLAGLTTMWFMSGRMRADTQIAEVVQPPVQQQQVVIAESKQDLPAVELKPAEWGADYEWKAVTEPANRAANFLKAGNLYLEKQQDYDAALRCYKQGLDIGGAAVLDFTESDNWLIMALKNDRRREKTDER